MPRQTRRSSQPKWAVVAFAVCLGGFVAACTADEPAQFATRDEWVRAVDERCAEVAATVGEAPSLTDFAALAVRADLIAAETQRAIDDVADFEPPADQSLTPQSLLDSLAGVPQANTAIAEAFRTEDEIKIDEALTNNQALLDRARAAAETFGVPSCAAFGLSAMP